MSKVLLIGPESGGKTTLLYQLKYSEFVQTPPTFGFNCETIFFNDLALQLWDVGGSIKQFHHTYLKDTKVMVFVVDASDREKIGSARLQLYQLIDDLPGLPVVVVGNKCDKTDVMGKEEIVEKLMLNRSDLKWQVVMTSAVNNIGVRELLKCIYMSAYFPASINS